MYWRFIMHTKVYIKKAYYFFQIIISFALLGLSLAAPQQPSESTPPIPILKYESEGPNPDGSYRWA